MQAINNRVIVKRYGGPETLETIEEPLREPEKGELRVKVECAGVALADVMRRRGLYPQSPPPPFTPGYDAIGRVDECGEDVGQFSIGDRVGVFYYGTGGYSSYVYVKEGEAIPVPSEADAAEAVSILLNYVTAYQMLHRLAGVSEGDSILIHGAAGGVGTALLELGRLAKTNMYGTASSAKHTIVQAFGALPIDYRNEDFVDVLKERIPGGVDAVFDPIGGDNWNRSFQTLSPNGRFIGYGYTSVLDRATGADWIGSWSALSSSARTDKGNPAYLYSITSWHRERPDWYKEDAAALFSLLAQGLIRPVIAKRFPLKEAAAAHQTLESSAAAGKIILDIE